MEADRRPTSYDRSIMEGIDVVAIRDRRPGSRPDSTHHLPSAQFRRCPARRLPPRRRVFGVPPAFYANGIRAGPFCRPRALRRGFGSCELSRNVAPWQRRIDQRGTFARSRNVVTTGGDIDACTTADTIGTADRCFRVDPAGHPLEHRISRCALPRSVALATAVAFVALSGCAVRYDGTGTSRVGVGLWGLGDPPGVNWDLDWPRRDVPDLPPMRPQELPDRPGLFRTSGGDGRFAELHNRDPRHSPAIDDNRGCDFDGNSSLVSSRVAPPGDAGGGDAAGVWR